MMSVRPILGALVIYIPFEALFINRHLNRDMWKLISAMS